MIRNAIINVVGLTSIILLLNASVNNRLSDSIASVKADSIGINSSTKSKERMSGSWS